MDGHPRTFVEHKLLHCEGNPSLSELGFLIPNVYYLSLLRSIVRDDSVMSWLGSGDSWDEEKLLGKLRCWYQEWTKPEGERDELVWVVIFRSTVVGVVRLYRFQKTDADFDNEWFCTTVISSLWQGRGIGSAATEVCCRAFQTLEEGRNKRVFATVSNANVLARETLTRAGFVRQEVRARLGPQTFSCSVFVLPPRSGITTTATESRTADGGVRGGASRTPFSRAAEGGSSQP